MNTVKARSWTRCATTPIVVVAVAFFTHCADMCANEKLAEYTSPDQKWTVVVFQRDCGATTDFSTQASLLPFGAALPNEGGNIFIADTDHGAAPRVSHGGPELQVLWEATDRVLLSHDATARLFKADEHRSSITFRYESLTVREPDNSR